MALSGLALGAAGAGAAYVSAAAYMFARQRALLYQPCPMAAAARRNPAAAGAPEMTAVEIETEDGLNLVAWRAGAAAADSPTVAYFHGNAGTLADRVPKVRPFIDAGFGVLLLAWRGYSGNPGAPSQAGLMADARAALDHLAAEGVAAARVVLYGESLGTGVAVPMAVERGVRCVVLEAPPSSIVDIARRRYRWLPVRLLLRDRFETAAVIARVNAPLLIMHGARDETVPIRHGRRLHAAAGLDARFWEAPNAGHGDLFEHGAADAALEFIQSSFR